MAKEVNRKFDVAALAAIMDKVSDTGALTLKLSDAATASRLRMQFYLWRKRERELNADQSFLADIMVRVKDSTITFNKNFENVELREVLAAAGIIILENIDIDAIEEGV